MPATYEPISTQTIGTAVATVTLSSIPLTYTDLVLVVGYGSNTSGGENLLMQFNGDTATNYSNIRLVAGGGGAGSFGDTSAQSINIGAIYGTADPMTHISQINNYANATTYKTLLCRHSTTNNVAAHVGLWRSTAAITSVTFRASAGNFGIGSTFTLYGVKAA
jgi:hypothetical protein